MQGLSDEPSGFWLFSTCFRVSKAAAVGLSKDMTDDYEHSKGHTSKMPHNHPLKSMCEAYCCG